MSADRSEALATAVGLSVDADDFRFDSQADRELWCELEPEFQEFVVRIGPIRIAD